MKITQNNWFWILQIVGWGSFAILNAWAKTIGAPSISKAYLFWEGFVVFTTWFLSTTLFRYYIKKFISLEKFNTKEILKVLIAFFCVGMIYMVLTGGLVSIIYPILLDKKFEISTALLVGNLFIALIILLLWLILYISFHITLRYRKNKIEQLELVASLKESQLNTLKGQINPHFMFNSLNNIRGLMLEDVEKSREMITRLSEMLRYSLTKNNIDKIALTDELEMVDNYIALSKIQLENRLKFESKIDKNLLQIEIPPMFIQMLVENAVKHGISNLPKGGIISLDIFKENKTLNIKVKNTGKLIAKENSTKVGLENIKKRLILLYGKNSNFYLVERDNQVIATIQIPLN